MPAISGTPTRIAGTPKNPITITNTGSVDIYTATDNSASKANHVGTLKPNGSTIATADVWLVTDGSAGSYSTSTGDTSLATGELGYAEILSNFGPTAGVANTIYPVTGLSIAVVTATRPIEVEAYVPDLIPSVANATSSLQIWEDGAIVQTSQTVGSATASKRQGMFAKVRRNPAPGAHTYDVRVKSDIAATITLEAGVGFPAWVGVKER